jgi:FtsP/CotA-like multicopper oxidase with cupredoxin domain
MKRNILIALAISLISPSLYAGAGHQMDMLAMVMNGNSDRLPMDCDAVSEDVQFTVRAGTGHAINSRGKLFGYSSNDWQVPPCARVTVTFINDDDVRHQWMLHGLPKYLYPQGMFHMELNGRGQTTGSFIVPSDDRTYLVHCDIPQHTEKGMKAQLKVGKGSGNLDSVPGVSGDPYPDNYRISATTTETGLNRS